MGIKCKRIIDGKTYNTETATQLAGHDEDLGPYAIGTYLFQTRFGAFFKFSYREADDEDDFESIEPLTPEEARDWIERYESYNVDLIERLFGKFPEAGAGEIKYTLRMPESLRNQLAAKAKANKQSLNAWIIRCLEGCAAETSSDGAGEQHDIPPMGNMVGSNRTGWRTRRA